MNTKSILLAVTGLTPQVVTETLHAIQHQSQGLPEQIHILTTAEGYQRARLTLINDGWLARFTMTTNCQNRTFPNSISISCNTPMASR